MVWYKTLKLYLEYLNLEGRLGELWFRLMGLYRRGYLNAMDIQVAEHTLRHPRLPEVFDGYRILVMADFHIDGRLPITDSLVRKLSAQTADACVLLGDYRASVLGPYEHAVEEMAKVATAVRAKDGTFGIRGNHDAKEMCLPLSQVGIDMLINESRTIERGENRIWLVGVDDTHFSREHDIARAVSGIPENSFKILLAHSPEIYREASRVPIQIYLCGHTHGGQVLLRRKEPIIINARCSRKLAHGEWRYSGMTGYTTLGVGTSAIPVRFNCPPEIAIITLRRSENENG
jgi:predicted MPP superfamily phosphohydrolase